MNPFTLDPKTLKAALEGQRYRIGPYKEVDGVHSYGLMVCQSSIFIHDNDGHIQSHDGKKYASVAVTGLDDSPQPRIHAKRKLMSSTTLIHPIAVVIYGILVAGLEALVVSYNQTGGDTAFERFMDSNSFGVTFLFTAVGVGIKLYWSLLDDGKPSSPSRGCPHTDVRWQRFEPWSHTVNSYTAAHQPQTPSCSHRTPILTPVSSTRFAIATTSTLIYPSSPSSVNRLSSRWPTSRSNPRLHSSPTRLAPISPSAS